MNAQSVYNILVRKGVTATVRTFPDAEFIPGSNTTVKRTPIEYTVKVIPPYSYVKESYKPTTLITYGKGLTGIANYNLGFTVKAGLVLIINNQEWTVTGVSPIQDATGIIMYTLDIES